jgi:hypothetical protein
MSSPTTVKPERTAAHIVRIVGRTLARLRTEPSTAATDAAILDLEHAVACYKAANLPPRPTRAAGN